MKKIIDELIKEVRYALDEKEVPIAAVITKNNAIIASNHNRKIQLFDPTAHAEILCIKRASSVLKTWNLNDCVLYSTIKPCKMCESVIKEARIKEVYYILDSNSESNDTCKYNKIENNILSDNYKKIINEFFKEKR